VVVAAPGVAGDRPTRLRAAVVEADDERVAVLFTGIRRKEGTT